MRAFGIVEDQIFSDGCPSLAHIATGVQKNLFIFDCSPQPFQEDILPPSTSPVHGDTDFGILQHLAEGNRGNL